MSKSDAKYSEIQTSRVGSRLRKPEWRDNKPVVAFDFETDKNGDPFLLSVSPPDSDSYCIEPEGDRETLSTKRILDELSSNKWRGYLCIWFNIGFDAEVFISGLGVEHAQEIRIENETELEEAPYEGLTVTYIDGKLLEFQHKNGHKISHYDIGNIVRGSLDNCAEEWLGENKDETVDASEFSDPEYREEHWNEIKYYARIDAQLTRRLTEVVTKKAESLDIPMGRPISTGYMAAEYVRQRFEEKPGSAPTWVQSMAWEAYAGGRFEVYERGDVGEVAGPDINSAYPAILSELPDADSLSWENVSNPSYNDCLNADYGFVTVRLSTVSDRRIMPFAEKIDGKVCYPAMEDCEITVLLPIFEHAVEEGYITEFEVLKLAAGYETERTFYPFKFLKDLYDERKELEANGQDLAGLMLKIVLNSLYGKTAQTTLKKKIDREQTSIDDIKQEDGKRLITVDDIPVIVEQVAGSLFNPFLASYITGMTRLELHKAVLDCGLEDNTVLFATDCIMVDSEAYKRSQFDKKLGDTLGEWDFDYKGEAFVVGSGVYEVDLGQCAYRDCEHYQTTECDTKPHYLKTATRGFREADLGDEGLRGDAREAGSEPITIANERPVTLGEALSRGSDATVDEIGRFLSKDETERALSADFDTKRDWDNEPSFSDLLEEKEYAQPLAIDQTES